jgi:hypothetical protein
MKIFLCDACGQPIFFENVQCTQCGHTLGYLPDRSRLSAIEKDGEGFWRPLAPDAGGRSYRMCANYAAESTCNWMIPSEHEGAYCQACRLNQTIPDLSRRENRVLWGRLESAKRRLIYSLLRLGLPLAGKGEDKDGGLAFAFLADPDPPFRETDRIVTGHAGGLITINIAEADDAVRERMRQSMAEPYRTILGHLRHESGHYYWQRLVSETPWHTRFRSLFGDETTDYARSLERHYEQGPSASWPTRFISGYASSHPWEDWAETWAHYLHIVDTLETAYQFGLRVAPRSAPNDSLSAEPAFDPYESEVLDPLMDHWLPLTYAVNSLNRSMGQRDLYPFVLPAPGVEKLDLVHQVIRGARSSTESSRRPPAAPDTDQETDR